MNTSSTSIVWSKYNNHYHHHNNNCTYVETNRWFTSMFPPGEEGLQSSIQNQYEFLIQRFGGPPLFSARKGHPALKARHVNFHVNNKSSEKWLAHMKAAMEEVGIPEREKEAMMEFFIHTAAFLQNRPDDTLPPLLQ
eukprot:GEZU01016161.1.p1 GENE.GEZU01016161.1~~GEZU01016161.1.p1  ORF type:complete len:137 (+),score=22.24 GEZU01016161.1:1248-1658(+)